MSNRTRSLVGLLVGILAAAAGWIAKNGVEAWADLSAPQSVAGLILVSAGVVVAWLTQSHKDASERDRNGY